MSNFVASLGGSFIYSDDPKALAQWYHTYLGLLSEDLSENTPLYAVFHYHTIGEEKPKSGIVWAIMKASEEMAPKGRQRAMINYRIKDMEALRLHFASLGVELEVKHYPGEGYFAHTYDLDGNKIELWQDQYEEAEASPE